MYMYVYVFGIISTTFFSVLYSLHIVANKYNFNRPSQRRIKKFGIHIHVLQCLATVTHLPSYSSLQNLGMRRIQIFEIQTQPDVAGFSLAYPTVTGIG